MKKPIRFYIPLSIGVITTLIAAALISINTPDGNLLVTLAPAIVAGLIIYSFATWIINRRG